MWWLVFFCLFLPRNAWGDIPSNYFCADMTPQATVDIDQLMGIWYAIEIIDHNDQRHYIRHEPKCPIIHISEDTSYQTHNPLYRDYNYGYNYGQGYGNYRTHDGRTSFPPYSTVTYGRDLYNRDQYGRGQQYNRDQYNRDQYNRDQFNRDQLNRDQYNRNPYDRDQYNRNPYDRDPYYRDQYNRELTTRDPYRRDQYNTNQYNRGQITRTPYYRDQYNRDQYNRGQYRGSYGSRDPYTTSYDINKNYFTQRPWTPHYRRYDDEMRRLRLWWDDGRSTEYHLRFNVSKPGFWISSGPENGSSLEPQFRHFAGTIQVIKAVGDHLVLNFCHSIPDRQLYSVILGRQMGLSMIEISGVHNQLNRKGLATNNIKKVCNGAFNNRSSYSLIYFLFIILMAKLNS